MMRWPLSVLSPAGVRGRLSILIFHRVLQHPDLLFPEIPSATDFDTRMRWVSSWFNVLPLTQAIDRLYDGTIPERALSITFDDGYADNEEVAAPILKRLGLCATFFVATGFLHGGCMFNDQVIEAMRNCRAPQLDLRSIGLETYPLGSIEERRRSIEAVVVGIRHLEPERRHAATKSIAQLTGSVTSPKLMMDAEQVRRLRALGMEIGAHTVTHPILTRLSADQAFDEIRSGKRELEQILNESVHLLAYPNGMPGRDFAAEHALMARDCGFGAAVTTAWGAATVRSERFQLPRFTPWDRSKLRFGARMLANFRRVGTVAR
jgi:peptidoglycan/xylan/chitin deacetylase (PgdA/CDA1 family)